MNCTWNYKFWLLSTKIYKEKSYWKSSEEDFQMDFTFKLIPKNKLIHSKKRFSGYFYNNKIYLDNPGVKEMVDSDTWNYWLHKKFVKF